jgi:putative hemolysin
MSGLNLILLCVALVGSAIYSGIETGVVSVNRLRLQHLVRRQYRHARLLQRFVDQPDLLLGTTLVGNNICNVAISVISAHVAVQVLPETGLWVASVGSTVVLLIFGEYLPKTWFRSYPAYRVLPFAPFLDVSARVFYPLRVGVMQLAQLMVPNRKAAAGQAVPFVTREELAYLTREGEQTGELTTTERRMMQGVLALTHKTCADIMIPLAQMVRVQADTPAAAVLDLARKRSLSRVPVYRAGTDTFTGLVHVLDLLIAPDLGGRVAHDFARPPQFAAVGDRVDRLLPRMQRSRQPLALVQDGEGQVVGLVSIEDILEEIVGEM